MTQRPPSLADLEALASRALASIPRRFRQHLGQVVVRVEEFPDKETERALRLDSAASDPHTGAELGGAGSVACVPLIYGEVAVGALVTVAAQPAAFTDDDVETLRMLGQIVAIALHRAYTYPRPRYDSFQDALTGLGNRRAFDERLEAEVNFTRRFRHAFSLALVELDGLETAIDRLGELSWLGPLSVVLFGLLVGLVVQAAAVPQFDRWMLLLTVGTFAGAYPLMYFAQEYLNLVPAVLISAEVSVTIIGVRALTLMGISRALFGIVIPAVVILAITLTTAIYPQLQGMLLTVMGLGFFITAMLLMAKSTSSENTFWRLSSHSAPAVSAP